MTQDFDGGKGQDHGMEHRGKGPAGHMVHADTRALYKYWEALRAERATPYRAEVDPRDMGCDPRDLFILEDLGRGNVRFRLAGTGLCDRFGMEMRGMSVRSIMQLNARDQLSGLIEEVLKSPGIGYLRLVARKEGRAETRWEMLLLPLRSDFGQTDRLLGSLRQISGFPVNEADQPLRFTIEEMSLTPVTGSTHAEPRDMPLAGFGEARQKPFLQPKPAPNLGAPKLKSIEGGLNTDDEAAKDPDSSAERRRAHFRLVKD